MGGSLASVPAVLVTPGEHQQLALARALSCPSTGGHAASGLRPQCALSRVDFGPDRGVRSSGAWTASVTTSFLGIQLLPVSASDCRSLIGRSTRSRTRVNGTKESMFLRRTVAGFTDPELHSVFELASDAELLDLSNILYGKSFLSPLVKSLTPGDGSIDENNARTPKTQADRDALMGRLEARFLYLAADAKATLSGRRPSYRNVLLQVRKKLLIPCADNLSTEDMESEIFLHVLQKYSRNPSASSKDSTRRIFKTPERGKTRWWQVGLPPITTLRGKEFVSAFVKGGGAVTVSALQRVVVRKLVGKLLVETARYQVAKDGLVKGGQVAMMLETRVAMLAAKQGLIGAAKRYATLRSAMAVLGPMLWGSLLADMLISSVGTDYARVVRAIYAFAQIRLVRAYTWDDTSQV